MKVITLLNAKGGVGKTILANHLAYGLAAKGARVMLVDGDPQGHATIRVIHGGATTRAEHEGGEASRLPNLLRDSLIKRQIANAFSTQVICPILMPAGCAMIEAGECLIGPAEDDEI